jgi:D-alanyl-D-alanine carboxypeptidase
MTGQQHRYPALLRQIAFFAAKIGIGFFILVQPVFAYTHHHPRTAAARHHPWHRAPAHVAYRANLRAALWGRPTDPTKDAELIIDGRTGRVLYGRNADVQRHPASLTKMMTLYLLFDALKKGHISFTSPVYISRHAAMQKPTKLGMRPGDSLPVDMAIRAAVVLSANDIAVAIAETLGGTESHFAELMTAKARELGMRNTFYHNASGLPDDRQITTASDLGVLAHHLAYDFPQYYGYFALEGFTFRGRPHLGHDNLLGRYEGADGIKTGYTNASGFNLVSSVVRNGVHIIGVVMGGYSARRRDMEMVRLLDWSFATVNARPALVAHADAPWQTMAQTSNVSPVVAGFQFSKGAGAPSGNLREYASMAPKGEEDEESAESRGDNDEIAKLITNTPQPQVGAQQLAPQSQAPAPQQSQPQTRVASSKQPDSQPSLQQVAVSTKPSLNLAMVTAPAQIQFPAVHAASNPPPTHIPNVYPTPRDNAVPLTLASDAPPPQSIPQVMPVPRSSVAEDNRPGSIKVTTAPGTTTAKLASAASAAVATHSWTIQIGAFNDVPTARAELAAYAEKPGNELRGAERIIVPFTGSDGKIMYRARFGTFAEQEARAICLTLTHQGHSCFASTLAR